MFSHKKKENKTSTKLFFKKNEYIQEKFVRYILVRMHTENRVIFRPGFLSVFFFVALFYFLKVLQCFKFAEKKIIILHKSFHPVLSSPLDKSKTFRVENISVFSISMYLQCLMSDPNLQGPLFLGPTITLF